MSDQNKFKSLVEFAIKEFGWTFILLELAAALLGSGVEWFSDPKFPGISDNGPIKGALVGLVFGFVVHLFYRLTMLALTTSENFERISSNAETRFDGIATRMNDVLLHSPQALIAADSTLKTTMGQLQRNALNRAIVDVMVNDSPFTGILGTLYTRSDANEVIEDLNRDDYLRYLGEAVTLAKSSYLTLQYGGLIWFQEFEWFFEYFYRKANFRCIRILVVESEQQISDEQNDHEKVANYWRLVGANTTTYWITIGNLLSLRESADAEGLRQHRGHEVTDLQHADIVVCDRKLCFQFNESESKLDFWHNPKVDTFPYDWVFSELDREQQLLGPGNRKFIEVQPPQHYTDLRQLRFRESKAIKIDCAKIRDNYKQLLSIRPNTKIMAITKSDGYGLGITELGECLVKVGCNRFGVSTIEEALKLRAVTRDAHILLMEGTNGLDVPLVVRYGLESLIWDYSICQILNAEARREKKIVQIHVKVNSGMNRLGVRPENLEKLLASIGELSNVSVAGVCSHLSTGHQPTGQKTKNQFELFENAIQSARAKGLLKDSVLIHVENSASFVSTKEPYGNMARIGGLLFGSVCPIPNTEVAVTNQRKFSEAVSVVARVLQIQQIESEDTPNPKVGREVSYDSRDFTASGEGQVAIVNIGYGDGVPMQWGRNSDSYALIRGKRYKPAGEVCMGLICLDVTGGPPISAGDEVVFIGASGGERISLTDFSKWSQCHAYEVLCRLGASLPRSYDGLRDN